MFKFLYSPEDNNTPATSGMSDLDILNQEIETPSEEATEEEQPFSFDNLDTTSEEDEEVEIEAKPEDESEEKEEPEVKEEGLTEEETKVLESRPSLTDIKTKYPNIFKDYPDLKHVLYREAAYSDVFPTVKEAKAAAGKAQTLDSVETALFERADAEGLFQTVAKQDKKAFEAFAANVIPAIAKVDEAVYLEVLKPVFKLLARSMFANGSRNKNDNLKNSALYLHDYVFQNDELDKEYEPKYAKARTSPESEELTRKQNEFETRQYGLAVKDINERLVKRMKKSIEASLAGIGDGVSDYIKEVIANKTVDRVFEALKSDQSFGRTVTGLIPDLRKTGYSEDSKVRIITAYLTRAKSLIPNIRKEELTKALGGKVKDSKVEVKKPPTRVIPSGQTGKSSTATSGKKPDWKVVPKGKAGELAILGGKY